MLEHKLQLCIRREYEQIFVTYTHTYKKNKSVNNRREKLESPPTCVCMCFLVISFKVLWRILHPPRPLSRYIICLSVRVVQRRTILAPTRFGARFLGETYSRIVASRVRWKKWDKMYKAVYDPAGVGVGVCFHPIFNFIRSRIIVRAPTLRRGAVFLRACNPRPRKSRSRCRGNSIIIVGPRRRRRGEEEEGGR